MVENHPRKHYSQHNGYTLLECFWGMTPKEGEVEASTLTCTENSKFRRWQWVEPLETLIISISMVLFDYAKCPHTHLTSKESSSTSPGKSTEVLYMTEWESMRYLLWSDEWFITPGLQTASQKGCCMFFDCVRLTHVLQLVAAHQCLMCKSFGLFSVIPGSMITVWDLSLWTSPWRYTN